VVGSGHPDLVFMSSWSTNMDAMWDEPSLAAYMERLASFSRVICYDERGTGVSDSVPLASLPTIEQWTDDARTVMDTVGVEQATLQRSSLSKLVPQVFAADHATPGLGHDVSVAIFKGPGTAVTCAARMVDALRELG
jgi:pimeloyl-ACP methyl ester carboxylesterase